MLLAGPVAAPQSRSCKGWFVGRRSAVSSSSALRASSCRASPSARATRSATSQVGLEMPRSRPRMDVGSRSAESARASCVRPSSSRRRRMARPRATWGLWLIRTPETLFGRRHDNQGTSSRYSSSAMSAELSSRPNQAAPPSSSSSHGWLVQPSSTVHRRYDWTGHVGGAVVTEVQRRAQIRRRRAADDRRTASGVGSCFCATPGIELDPLHPPPPPESRGRSQTSASASLALDTVPWKLMTVGSASSL